jgi:uncharacterized protein involved in response to NO
MADNKLLFGIIALALVGFLLVTSPGWNKVLGLEGTDSASFLGIVVLILVIGGMYWVVTSAGGGEEKKK